MVAPKKVVYFSKLHELVETHSQVMIVEADHVGSKQMAEIRFNLRGKATLLMGKNTMIRTALKQKSDANPKLNALSDLIKLNVGMVFCKGDVNEVRDIIKSSRVPAPARQGVIAPLDVFVKAGPTGMDPSQTNFFQTLGIATKIVKGQIEIQNDFQVIKVADKVSASQSVLLQKLKIMPFSFGLVPTMVYDDGQTYPAAVLDVTPAAILEKFRVGLARVAAASLAINHPTKASIPHLIATAFKQSVAIAMEADHCFPRMEGLKKFIENPEAFAAAAAPAAAPAAAAAADKKEAKKAEPEPEEEEEGDLGFSLFD